MAKFGKRSKALLALAHPDLVKVANAAIRIHDFTVLCTQRSENEQNYLFQSGLSKLQYPKSKHNQKPAHALDLAPWPIDWKDTEAFYYLAGIVMASAHAVGVKLRWGGDWDGDGDLKDQTFMDLGHFELDI